MPTYPASSLPNQRFILPNTRPILQRLRTISLLYRFFQTDKGPMLVGLVGYRCVNLFGVMADRFWLNHTLCLLGGNCLQEVFRDQDRRKYATHHGRWQR